MTDLLNKLDLRFKSEIKLVQFALDGNWEKAWIIEKDNIPPETSKLEKFLQNKFTNFACEIFFEDTENINMFFGIRYVPNRDHLVVVDQFISKLCVALSIKNIGVKSLVTQISQELGNTPLLSRESSHRYTAVKRRCLR